MRRTHRLLALWTAAMLAACAGPAAPSMYQPSAQPTAKVRAGDFTLRVASPRDRWEAGEPIEVTATLTYDGAGSTTIYGSEPVPLSFGVREIRGTRDMAAFLTY